MRVKKTKKKIVNKLGTPENSLVLFTPYTATASFEQFSASEIAMFRMWITISTALIIIIIIITLRAFKIIASKKFSARGIAVQVKLYIIKRFLAEYRVACN